MKNIYLSIVLLFAVLLSVNFVSAAAVLGHEFGGVIYGLSPSSSLTIDKIMVLCTKENCNIDSSKKTVTIQSHYDNRIALTLSQNREDKTKINLYTEIPYEINNTAVDNCNKGLGCDNYFILHGINPQEYNWSESRRVDLSYLKEIGVIDISNPEIDAMQNLAADLIKCGDTWETRPICPTGCDGKGPCEGAAQFSTEPFPTLPLKEFSLIQKSSSNLIYWITGIIIIAVIMAVFIIKRKK